MFYLIYLNFISVRVILLKYSLYVKDSSRNVLAVQLVYCRIGNKFIKTCQLLQNLAGFFAFTMNDLLRMHQFRILFCYSVMKLVYSY